jgi:hypothetical protein
LIQSGIFKPLPPRPDSCHSCDSKEIQIPKEIVPRKSTRSTMSGAGSDHSGSSSHRSTTAPLVRIYFGGEELVINLDDPAEMPTIFILCPQEEDELRFESRNWGQLSAFCQKFKEVTIRADFTAAGTSSEAQLELHVAVMEFRKRIILTMSLRDTVMIARDIKPIMKTRLSLPTTLGQVVEECDQIPIGLYV